MPQLSPTPQNLHDKVWPKRLPHSISPPATSLWHNLAVSALRFPDKAALVFFDRVLTYRQVMLQAEALAATLCRMGVKKGDRVMPSSSFVVRPHAKNTNCALLLEHLVDKTMLNVDSPRIGAL